METKRIVFISPLGREEAEMFLKTIPDGVAVEAKAITVAPFFDKQIEEAVANFQPDLIVLNTMLQGDDRDGLRMLKKIKGSRHLGAVPVMVISVLFNAESDLKQGKLRGELMESGVAGVLPKFPWPSYDSFMSHC